MSRIEAANNNQDSSRMSAMEATAHEYRLAKAIAERRVMEAQQEEREARMRRNEK